MKKFLVTLVVSLLLVGGASAYTIQYGDTLTSIAKKFNTSVDSLVQSNDIQNPDVIFAGDEMIVMDRLGATPTPTSSANRMYVEASDFQLYTGAASGDTTLTIDDLEDIYGNDITMDYLGSKGYARINPDGVGESISFTGITTNSDGTKTLTGVKTVEARYPYTETSGLVRSHSIGSLFRLSNTAGFYNDLANKENNEIIEGQWNFDGFIPYIPTSTPTDDRHAVSLYQFQQATTTGGINGSETQKGVWEGATQAEMSAGTNLGSSGAELVLKAQYASSTNPSTSTIVITDTSGYISNTFGGVTSSLATLDTNSLVVQNPANASQTSASNAIVQAGATGLINDGFLNSYNVSTKAFTAGEDITGATTPQPVYYDSASSSVKLADGNDTSKLKFIGFAVSTASSTETVYVQIENVVSGFTGLTAGSEYYISDTAGSISATAGTYDIKVGVAISATQILIRERSRGYQSGTVTLSATGTTTITTGFRVDRVNIHGLVAGIDAASAVAWSHGGWTLEGGNDAVYMPSGGTGGQTSGALGGSAWSVGLGTEFHRGSVEDVTDTTFSLVNTKTGSGANAVLFYEAEGNF